MRLFMNIELLGLIYFAMLSASINLYAHRGAVNLDMGIEAEPEAESEQDDDAVSLDASSPSTQVSQMDISLLIYKERVVAVVLTASGNLNEESAEGEFEPPEKDLYWKPLTPLKSSPSVQPAEEGIQTSISQQITLFRQSAEAHKLQQIMIDKKHETAHRRILEKLTQNKLLYFSDSSTFSLQSLYAFLFSYCTAASCRLPIMYKTWEVTIPIGSSGLEDRDYERDLKKFLKRKKQAHFVFQLSVILWENEEHKLVYTFYVPHAWAYIEYNIIETGISNFTTNISARRMEHFTPLKFNEIRRYQPHNSSEDITSFIKKYCAF